MKLIGRKPRLSGRIRTIILAMVLSLVSASTAVATVFSINIAHDGNSSVGAGAGTAREQSGSTSLEKVVGEWVVIVTTSDGTEPEGGRSLMIVEANGNRLTGKVIFKTDGEPKEWVLIEPKFDGESFTFKVNNGEELLAATLKLKNDQFEGSYRGSISDVSGGVKLVRKTIENTK